jgi:serine/threonine protein kinase
MGVVTSHPTDQTIRSYGLGELDDHSSLSVWNHLGVCTTCQRRLAEMLPNGAFDRITGTRPQADRTATGEAAGSVMAADRRRGVSGSPPEAATLPQELAEHPDYEIVRELGRGGMGVVYLARNKLMGRSEVLKLVSGHLLEHAGVRGRFLREIQSAARLQHQNIVTAYSAMRLGRNIVLAMEYVEGDDLAKIVRSSGPLSVANACYVIYQAALGLQHAHERGMVHRDIKPANLILGREGTKTVAKVLDFGLAKVTSEGPSDTSLTRHGQTMGTPDFIAPEQIRNTQSADIRADIYSLGCTFYYLLTGGPPFRGENPWDVYQAHFSVKAEPLNLVRPEVPAELAALVAKMMAKAPARRFQTPAEAAQAIFPFFQKALAAGEMSNASIPAAERQKARPAASTAPVTKNQTATTRPEPSWETLIQFKEPETLRDPAAAAQRPQGRWLWPAAVGALLLLALVIAWALVATGKAPTGVIELKNVPQNAVVEVDGERIAVDPAAGQPVTIEIRAGKHVVVVKRGAQVLMAESVGVEAGKHSRLNVPAAVGGRIQPKHRSP